MGKKIYSDEKEKPEKIESNKIKDVLGLVLYCVVVIAIMFLVIKYVGSAQLLSVILWKQHCRTEII